jgi:hypothetical protein
MISRTLAPHIITSSKKYPLVAITGPRQSGKTTLAKELFPDYTYVSLENLNNRQFALEDPIKFLETYSDHVILDEVQRVPDIFSYLQTKTDESNKTGQYILTGSQQFLLMKSISQSLAGRIALHALLPLSLIEITSSYPKRTNSVDELLFAGMYPRIYDRDLDPSQWYGEYVQTYLDRDLRQLTRVSDLSTFERFLKLCAGRTGQQVNMSSLANDANISHNTANAWLSLLETSYIVTFLQPYYRNFNKRIIKAPKMYFLDTGLAAWLLGIESSTQLNQHSVYGALFETFIVSEYLKFRFHHNNKNNCFYWRDKVGHEIDLIIENGESITPIEIKSSNTINSHFFENIDYFKTLTSTGVPLIIHGGKEIQNRSQGNVYPWLQLEDAFTIANQSKILATETPGLPKK